MLHCAIQYPTEQTARLCTADVRYDTQDPGRSR